ncbi:MAG: ComEC/Rec2 family competence protein [Candidatus Paceibacterota bacterium]
MAIDIYFTILTMLIACALFLFFFFISKNNWSIIISIFLLAFSVGVIRFTTADVLPPLVFEELVGREVSLVGEVVEAPEFREDNQRLTIQVEEGDEQVKILVTANFDQEFKYGDEVSLAGALKKPENFITDQGKIFDYINYLKKDGILYLINYAEMEVVSEGNGNKIKHILFSIKDKFLEKINFVIPTPENLLLGGLILGERSAFSDELRQDFVDTGTIHIVALSGYNVTIVAEWIMRGLKFLSINIAFWAGILGIFLFVIMSGGQSTAVRAGTMAVLALLARVTGRGYDVARGLVLVGAIMIAFNPFVLVYDVSFQLSFIATVAVIFFAPRIEKYFLWIPKRFGLRDIAAVTTAAYIFVLPFILYKMGNLSLVALPANMLILPFIPPIMLLGFLTGFFGIIWYALSVPVGFFASILLGYQLRVVDTLANIPFAALTVPDFPFWLVIIIYAYFVYRLFGRSMKEFFTEKTIEPS